MIFYDELMTGAKPTQSLLELLDLRYRTHFQIVGQGNDAQTMASNGYVVKVYGACEPQAPKIEAANLARAGLSDWVMETQADLPNCGSALTLRRFTGEPFTPGRFSSSSLAGLTGFLLRIHRLPEVGVVHEGTLRAKLNRFRVSLRREPGALQLIEALIALLPNVTGVHNRFTHQDLWAGNILLGEDGAILVVDWGRARGDDPARDLAILKTGSLDLLGPEAALETLMSIVRAYPDPEAVWARLRFYVPLTYLHDLHWSLDKEPGDYPGMAKRKLPLAHTFFEQFTPLW